MKCRVCSQQIAEYQELENVEIDVTEIFSEPTISQKKEIKLYHCNTCGHSQMEYLLDDKYYETYQLIKMNEIEPMNEGGNSRYLKDYYINTLSTLKNLGEESCDSLIDIGCGVGTVLELAKDFFKWSEGIEPSIIEYRTAIEKGLQVQNICLDKNFFPKKGYQAVICLQVLEHLQNPKEVMNKIYDILDDGGVGYIDIPNGQRIYNENQYYNIFLEHVNYYSITSIVKLIGDAGLEIISAQEILNGNHIGVYFRKNVKALSLKEKKEKDIMVLSHIANKYNKVAIWGAGIKGRIYGAILENIFSNKIKYVFDNMELYNNRYICNCNAPITTPSLEKVSECEIIIITAVEYKTNIVSELKKKFLYTGAIVCINEL